MEKDHVVEGRGEILYKSSPFEALPEECISHIYSLTSPRDACVAVSLSKLFGPAVDSDSVWEKFLLPGHQSLIPKSRIFSSKKELYFVLCNNLVYIQDGGKSVCLDKESGKTCVMLSAKQLEITFDSHYFWQWISIPESRFDQVPELLVEVPFKISGVMSTQTLSPKTCYSAYIVYKTRDRFHGLKHIGVGFIGQGTRVTKRWERKNLTKLEEREDGWMETELGEFFTEFDCEEIVLSIIEIDYAYWKRGLIIQGIDIRPTKSP
ncbi:PREDICTED: F-box protein At2g02240-like [Camelina sativa]|uniref:F-box protein At2g02240-like n=1 Tax=Camelina sativa TaxID=90675 RepID=A0ABM1RKN7_CAMSA|nr:PREDICTED: F-box protein At2g02240-like [Camelina sativa]